MICEYWMVLTFYHVHDGNGFFYSISYRVCNNIAGPCLVGHETSGTHAAGWPPMAYGYSEIGQSWGLPKCKSCVLPWSHLAWYWPQFSGTIWRLQPQTQSLFGGTILSYCPTFGKVIGYAKVTFGDAVVSMISIWITYFAGNAVLPDFQNWRLARWCSSFSNHSVTSPTSQLILQSFRCFTYVTVHSPTLLSLLHHRLFTYVTCQDAHGQHV